MIIDAHAQFGPGLRTDSPQQPAVKAFTAEELVAVMDSTGIDAALVSAPKWVGGSTGSDFVDPNYESANAAIARGMSAFPKRIIGIARVNPKFGSRAVGEFRRCLTEYGFRGLYLNNESEGFTYGDLQLVRPLLDVCASAGVPVFAYTWVSPSQPIQLLQLARAFPSVKIVMLHSGWRLTADASLAAQEAPNLYFDTSLAGPGVARGVTRRFGLERIVFGSFMPWAMPDVELDRVRRWSGLTGAPLDAVLGGNAARLIGLAA
jgi:predicted TIM-barrel fold metal-dependent hydrolase